MIARSLLILLAFMLAVVALIYAEDGVDLTSLILAVASGLTFLTAAVVMPRRQAGQTEKRRDD